MFSIGKTYANSNINKRDIIVIWNLLYMFFFKFLFFYIGIPNCIITKLVIFILLKDYFHVSHYPTGSK